MMTEAPKISRRQLHILRHALGIAQQGVEYRNHYCPGGDDILECQALESLGLMTHFHVSWTPGAVYRCTPDGKRIARAMLP
jgi:hypothetical protein